MKKYFIFFDFQGVDTKIPCTSLLIVHRMDQIHKKVLANKTAVIMQRITNPYVLSGYLSDVFTASDKEEIDAKDKQSGSTVATQHLIHLLEKRGPKAFQRFIEVLKSDAMKEADLAMELENEERRLRGEGGMFLYTSELRK